MVGGCWGVAATGAVKVSRDDHAAAVSAGAGALVILPVDRLVEGEPDLAQLPELTGELVSMVPAARAAARQRPRPHGSLTSVCGGAALRRLRRL